METEFYLGLALGVLGSYLGHYLRDNPHVVIIGKVLAVKYINERLNRLYVFFGKKSTIGEYTVNRMIKVDFCLPRSKSGFLAREEMKPSDIHKIKRQAPTGVWYWLQLEHRITGEKWEYPINAPISSCLTWPLCSARENSITHKIKRATLCSEGKRLSITGYFLKLKSDQDSTIILLHVLAWFLKMPAQEISEKYSADATVEIITSDEYGLRDICKRFPLHATLGEVDEYFIAEYEEELE